MESRPVVTLFLLASVDGKISTGATSALDFAADLPKLDGSKEGLHQHEALCREKNAWVLSSGRTQEKLGVNDRQVPKKKTEPGVVLLDNRHLTEQGVRYFCGLCEKVIVVTSNPDHPAYRVSADNLSVLCYGQPNLKRALTDIYEKFGCTALTVRTGGTLNSIFLREKLIDSVELLVAPVLVGGADTPTLIDGRSIKSPAELDKLCPLQLEACTVLPDSYLHLTYTVRR